MLNEILSRREPEESDFNILAEVISDRVNECISRCVNNNYCECVDNLFINISNKNSNYPSICVIIGHKASKKESLLLYSESYVSDQRFPRSTFVFRMILKNQKSFSCNHMMDDFIDIEDETHINLIVNNVIYSTAKFIKEERENETN